MGSIIHLNNSLFPHQQQKGQLIPFFSLLGNLKNICKRRTSNSKAETTEDLRETLKKRQRKKGQIFTYNEKDALRESHSA